MSFDSPAANTRFAEKYGFNFPLLCDVDRAMGVAYGATDDPQAKGGAKRIGVVIGPDGKIKHYLPKVDARAFPRQALDLL